MTKILDLKKPYVALDKGSGVESKGADFIRQDGIIFAWSESNIRYEEAWWLNPEITLTSLVKKLREERGIPEGVKL